MRLKSLPLLALMLCSFSLQIPLPAATESSSKLEAGFTTPPDSAKPWVYWFWINGNIGKEGITKDLEAFQKAGVGGVIWMEVSGAQWPPAGKVKAHTPEWNEDMQWAISESARLGLEFVMTLDFGYGAGGPHITPENSMQKLFWSETEVQGGQTVSLEIPKPEIKKDLVHLRLNPNEQLDPKVTEMIENVDAYRDVAVLAIPLPDSEQARKYRIPGLKVKAGLDNTVRPRDEVPNPVAFTPEAVIAPEQIIDLTDRLDAQGNLRWEAPPGNWLILRIGHSSNYHMTRPSPAPAIGLEADRLAKSGIEAHFNAFLKPIFDGAGERAGKTLSAVHHDSWEAGWQNWTAAMPEEFKTRRGYNLRPWLPVLTGRVVGSEEASGKFLDDLCTTSSDLMQENFTGHLKELARPYGIKFSHESYGGLRVDFPTWAGIPDIPMSEFWARGNTLFPNINGFTQGRKTASSAANTYGRPIHAAEAFTADRGWRDHPYLLKALGDEGYAEGINRIVMHCAAHQPYENAIPGLSHRKWGNHFTRFNTWWFHSQPWMEYMARSQFLLQQGPSVSDVLYWPGEAVPINADNFRNIPYRVPEGYDYDVCSNEIFRQLKAEKGRIIAPSGTSYALLALPATNEMTPQALRKIKELADGGARILAGPMPVRTHGLNPEADAESAKLAKELWQSGTLITDGKIGPVLAEIVPPDFEGAGLTYIHRTAGDTDIYFVANLAGEPIPRDATFRITGKRPELWDPETGEIRALPEFTDQDGRITVLLEFGPMQSWFVVFRPDAKTTTARTNFPKFTTVREIQGPWQVTFDPKWGGPDKPVEFAELTDWTSRSEHDIRYYSGSAVYRKVVDLTPDQSDTSAGRLFLDLGKVEVMARVRINGKEAGVVWKPPYRIDITDAVKAGKNEIEIDVVNLWINRMIGDEFLPDDTKWSNPETLAEWPQWMLNNEKRPSGRFTFTTVKHYDAAPLVHQTPIYITKDSKPFPSGLLGPVTLVRETFDK